MIEINKAEDGTWVAVFNEELEKNLTTSSICAANNAESILADANILYENSRYPRAAALAILAEEEYSKSILLKICAQTKTWNSFFYNIIKKHPEKQAYAESIHFLFSEIRKIEESNRYRVIPWPIFSSISPGSRLLDDFQTKLKKQTIEKKKRDLYKQSMLYISLGKTGILVNSPNQIGQKEAAICFDYADKIKEYSNIILNNLQVKNTDGRFRPNTSYETNYATYWTICHKEGFDISLDIFNLLNSSPDDIKEKIENFLRDIDVIGEFIDKKIKKKPSEAISRCRDFATNHKILDQVKEQKKSISVRYSLLEELIEFALKK